MDPKLSNLDPKLQDAYNRVMNSSGTNQPPSAQTMQTPPPPPQMQPQDPASVQPLPSMPPSINQYVPSTPPPMEGTMSTMPPPSDQVSNPMPIPPTEPDPALASAGIPNVVDPMTPPPPAPAVTSMPPEPTPVSMPEPMTPMPTVVTEPIPPAPQSSSNSIPAGVSGGTTVAFNASNSNKNVGTTPVKKGGLRIMPVVVGLGIILLLVAYTFVWIILFNVKVPFLPQI